ncbi:Uracil permease [Vibrio stylophorae]|uniref:Uracil permease n=1 Tax=Vibrio stylophorae TaxID=659351 RepID=A0ABM8ZV42_9VIBR|nr:uracil-xanthine permease family protein [Vibrio stylophorae]CAH0534186.1 Uracil permease [Vibrio stylophorae]
MTQARTLQSVARDALTGGQMLFVAFGALVLVPLITGLDPNVAFFTAGIGTLIFQFCTKRQVPVFLASSFAFIAPISAGIGNWGVADTLGGLIAAGGLYLVLSALVKWRGVGMLHRYLPPVVVGPVIMVIGLNLAPVAVSQAMGVLSGEQVVDPSTALFISISTLTTTLLVAILGRGIFRLIPILAGITVGYSLSLYFGLVDFSKFANVPWFAMPNFTAPSFNWEAILFILPVAIAPAIEHIGDILAISSVTGKDYLKKPGLHRTMLGDGLATMAAAAFGGPPNTTYSEVTGAVMLTKAFNPVIMTWAAVIAILVSFTAPLGVFLQTIPTVVMGGIMTLLFGSIAVVGMNTLVRHKVDLNDARNLCIVSVILIFGIGGMAINISVGGPAAEMLELCKQTPLASNMVEACANLEKPRNFALQGIALCSIVGILLNLLLPKSKPE